jgi:Flp pilus assembly protein TadG
MRLLEILSRLRQDSDGAMVVETAIVAPVLVLMSLGAFQVSGIVARQAELQSAAAEAAAIALASVPDTVAKRTVLRNVVLASSGLPSNKVAVSVAYRCNTESTFTTNLQNCASDTAVASFVRIQLTDTYTPAWNQFGVGSPINYNVVRYVMIGQADAT